MSSAANFDQLVRFQPPTLAHSASLQAVIGKVLARWPDTVAEPPETDRERLVDEMRRRLNEDDWEDLPTSFVTKAARALFDEARRDRADLAGLRSFYFDEIRVSTKRSFLGAMSSIYIGSYEPRAPHTRALAAALRESRERIGGRWARLDQALPAWLDPELAPKEIARLMVGMVNPWEELKTIGLNSPHAPGVMDHAHLAFIGMIGSNLHKRSEIDRLFGWLRPERQEARMSGAAEAIGAVFEPWASADPSAEDQRHVIDFLVGAYGDPRVSSSGAWAGVTERHRAIILRWLTGENIRFFLDVVSAVEDSHMWEPRREFWLSLHEEGLIDAAWVAFSSEAARYANRQAGARSGQQRMRFGTQTAGGSRANTSLLILKVDSKILVEGSHNYKVHIFQANASNAPILYQRYYDCETIRLTRGALAKPHLGDWQGWVRERI